MLLIPRGGERDNRRKGQASKLQVSVNLEDLYNGVTQSFNVNRNVYCNQCKGSGAEGGETKECPTCKGRGVTMQNVNMGIMQMQMQQPCPKCKGKGRAAAKICKDCKGKRLV